MLEYWQPQAAGSVRFSNSNGLTIGTVGSVNGINAGGTISISTAAGDLTLAQNITTADTGSSAVILNAGKNSAAGTAGGGNIIIGDSAVVTTGVGGRATLYTGDITGSSGITDLIGSGSGKFRYDSNATTANYTEALGAGTYAVFREQPTITVAADNATVNYGTAPGLTTSSSGLKNGDTAGQAISVASSVAVDGSTSTSGNYSAGSHNLTPFGAASGLWLCYKLLKRNTECQSEAAVSQRAGGKR